MEKLLSRIHDNFDPPSTSQEVEGVDGMCVIFKLGSPHSASSRSTSWASRTSTKGGGSSLSGGAGNAASFRERANRNAEIRSLHHHVFDTPLVLAAVSWAGLAVVAAEPILPYHIVVLVKKPLEGADHHLLLPESLREIVRRSPFRTDRPTV